MGVKDELMGAGLPIQISLCVALAANFCNWLSFTTTSWSVPENDKVTDDYLGLWRLCHEQSFNCDGLDGFANDSFAATQAFAIFGFVALNVGFLLIILFIFYGSCKQNSEVGMASGILFIISAVTWLVAVIIFGADYYDDAKDVHNLGYSFAMAIIAAILAAIAGVLMILGSRGGASVGSK